MIDECCLLATPCATKCADLGVVAPISIMIVVSIILCGLLIHVLLSWTVQFLVLLHDINVDVL